MSICGSAASGLGNKTIVFLSHSDANGGPPRTWARRVDAASATLSGDSHSRLRASTSSGKSPSQGNRIGRLQCFASDQETTVWRHGRKFASVEDADEWEDMFRSNKELQAIVDMEKAKQEATTAREKEDNGKRTLQLSKSDFTISSIVDKINRGKLDLRPAYQREYVWSIRTASKLIESLLLNIPVPTLFFNELGAGTLEVVDGKQRLTSIWSFVKGDFPDGKEFRLTGLEVLDELNGKTFEELSDEEQETIRDYALNIHTISRHCDADFVFEVFERLNMGATSLNEQELRNCVYHGSYVELLLELANTPEMLAMMKLDSPHPRMKDRELILRFFAMNRTGPAGFKPPTKSWLNQELRNQQDLEEDEKQRLVHIFKKAVGNAYAVFGEGAFRPLKGGLARNLDGSLRVEAGDINAALWDTLMYEFAKYDLEEVVANQDAILDAFVRACKGSFKGQTLSTSKCINIRAEAWKAEMDKIMKGRKGPKKGRGA